MIIKKNLQNPAALPGNAARAVTTGKGISIKQNPLSTPGVDKGHLGKRDKYRVAKGFNEELQFFVYYLNEVHPQVHKNYLTNIVD